MANVVVLRDTSTGRVWNFGAAPTGTFTFGPPYNQGHYVLVNMSASSITVALFGQTYTVPAHTTWDFLANANMAPVKPAMAAVVPGKQTKTHGPENVPTSFEAYPFTAAQAQPPAPPLQEEEPPGSGPIQPNRTAALVSPEPESTPAPTPTPTPAPAPAPTARRR